MSAPSPHLLAVARGDAPPDLVLRGGRVVNVFTGEIERADVAFAEGRVAGVGDYDGPSALDLNGAFVAPGLIDAHVHVESSLCTPAGFASAVVPRGVTTAVIDPHELANVVGEAGVRYMADGFAGLPLEAVVMAPSCVPATYLATAGGEVDGFYLHILQIDRVVHGLAEVMNYPGAIGGDEELTAKLGQFAHRPIDGHAPGVRGRALNAYAAAGVGSDHESVTADEAREKLARGLYLLIREATNARNLDALLPIVTPANARRVCFCTDDRTPGDLLREGSVDGMVRRAIAFGIDPIEAIRMATLNPAEWFRLRHLGALAPGRAADAIVFDDLRAPAPRLVFKRGALVARDGKLVVPVAPSARKIDSRCVVKLDAARLALRPTSDRCRVIGLRPDQLVTDHLIEDVGAAGQNKMAVAERHGGPGTVGVGFVRGLGLARGALAGTVAHDHHNLVVAGADDSSMLAAADAVVKMGGGLAVAVGERVVARLALPVGGLMSAAPVEEVAAGYDALVAAARELGSPLADPFMALSFAALEVIPTLKLTDLGLVDVERFEVVSVFV